MKSSKLNIARTTLQQLSLRRSVVLCTALLVCAGVQTATFARPAPAVVAVPVTTAPATTKIPDCGPNGERICTPHGCYCV